MPISRGKDRVTAAASAPGADPCRAVSASAAGALPRAAVTNSSRTGPARFSAPPSSRAVSLRALRLMPAPSRSPTAGTGGRTPSGGWPPAQIAVRPPSAATTAPVM